MYKRYGGGRYADSAVCLGSSALVDYTVDEANRNVVYDRYRVRAGVGEVRIWTVWSDVRKQSLGIWWRIGLCQSPLGLRETHTSASKSASGPRTYL